MHGTMEEGRAFRGNHRVLQADDAGDSAVRRLVSKVHQGFARSCW